MAGLSESHEIMSPCTAAAPKGRLARLREIVRNDEAEIIDGIEVSPPLAQMIVAVHDGLTPHEQEVFAAHCNADFQSCVCACSTFQCVWPVANLLLHVLRSAQPTCTVTFWG
jgi:hypothetical protein